MYGVWFSNRMGNISAIQGGLKVIYDHILRGISLKHICRTYEMFKNSFEPESPTVKYDSRNSRSIFSQWRRKNVKNIPSLRIETGRFIDLQLHDRICG